MKDVDQLAGVNLDVVYVTTPIFSHHPVVKAIYSENVTSNLFVDLRGLIKPRSCVG